ncbi:asparagine synthase-related protein [Kitasatospora albolonga]
MSEQPFPAAYGFLASARTGGGQDPEAPRFATRGRYSELSERLRAQSVRFTLVHPGDDTSGAYATGADTLVVLAGEIYNRSEIDTVLDRAAASDAERVLGLVERYGLHAFRLVNGRFAALVAEGERVLLATDHSGSVPLYTRRTAGQVLAATEAKTLAAPHQGDLGFPAGGARRVRRLPGLHQVPAGSVLEIDTGRGTAETHRTWVPPVSRRIMSEEAAVDAVRHALEKAVARRLAPAAPPLVVLSGGIDSSGVAALADAAVLGPIDTLSMGTDRSNEFPQARVVADHLGSRHREITIPTSELLAQLPHTLHAAESLDAEVIEYLLPLTALYRRLDGPPRRVLTGYGADIPLGGMHREDRLPQLDTAVAFDMDTFDGLNEMSPVLSTASGHWSTHPYWDREVLELLTVLEAGLKRRYGRDKWVLRAAMGDVLPQETVVRPKLGVHEGSGTTSGFTLLVREAGVPEAGVAAAKTAVVEELFDRIVVGGEEPDRVDLPDVVEKVAKAVKG